MARRKRDDIHRPVAIRPAEYRHLLCFSWAGPEEPSWNIEMLLQNERRIGNCFAGGNGGCDICGANYRYGDLWLHEPTQQTIRIGHICADKMGFHADRSAFVAERARSATRREKRRAKRARAVVLRGILRAKPDLRRALRVKHPIIQDIIGRMMDTRGSHAVPTAMSEKQESLVLKLAREAAAPQVEVPKAACPAGKIAVRARIVATKVQDGPYGTQIKGLFAVETPDGEWRCWGTVPSAILDATSNHNGARGSLIALRGSVEPSRDDPSFGFIKRPSAELLERAPCGPACGGCYLESRASS